MTDKNPAEINIITSWHAHVYFDPATTKDTAATLREWISSRFEVTMGRWHEVNVGPHTQAMYQVAFSNDVYPDLVPFLTLNRMDLVILVHPNTGNDYADHMHHAMWMGKVLEIDGSVLDRGTK